MDTLCGVREVLLGGEVEASIMRALLVRRYIDRAGGTNVTSLAASIGHPRETVKRKVDAMIAKNFIAKDEDNMLTVTDNFVREVFVPYTQTFEQILRLADAIRLDQERTASSATAQSSGAGRRMQR
ncbi:hypothetical protein ACSHT0_04425 [Tepidicaulis sp. LMO-SS28]|uniref:hypothetical protein n=1 Tax=Tepidicaulis sp. LMO-SS28 TaxID=3447455 RepID=UPI003EDEA67D